MTARAQSMYRDAHMHQKLITELTGVPVNRWVHDMTSRPGRRRRLSKHDLRHLIFNTRKGHAARKLPCAKVTLESELDVSVRRALNHKACRKPHISAAA